ncbi:MAG: regulatory iron-sulfur-containing complex subunit RicT [candidate division KSB1 bacterium]|nr:regulatory iron-sulfur-containing complex subunit RicT [candidate division KSB1 bacterium]MDZ7345479.1 regulatory iron-sulfur-containing complex subunit RicT [candidate division KSB1 bacterium]
MMIEILFKGERREIYHNPQQFPFQVGDYAIVEAEKGEDLGIVNQIGSLLERKRRDTPIRNIIRKPTVQDMARYRENRRKEFEAYQLCRKKVAEHGLDMKVVDVEYQFDGQKITFYFTAEKRIDFRALVKDLASIYKVRIELRQIGVRDEAKRIGGYGACGRKLCCTTWLKEFDPITTQCAKEQNLPLNPQKLSGLCSRLLCCLMYEREFYRQQAEKLPPVGTKYKTAKGIGIVTHYDVFKEIVTLQYEDNRLEVMTLEELLPLEFELPPDYEKRLAAEQMQSEELDERVGE